MIIAKYNRIFEHFFLPRYFFQKHKIIDSLELEISLLKDVYGEASVVQGIRICHAMQAGTGVIPGWKLRCHMPRSS